ncbi:MAG: hypothetical protein PVI74_03330, partial [Syntrophobacterales bacterium]
TPADWRKGERVWKPPQGAVQSRACRAVAMAKAGPLGPDSLLVVQENGPPKKSGASGVGQTVPLVCKTE